MKRASVGGFETFSFLIGRVARDDTWRTEFQEDGSILFKVVEEGKFSEELQGPDVENADKKV